MKPAFILLFVFGLILFMVQGTEAVCPCVNKVTCNSACGAGSKCVKNVKLCQSPGGGCPPDAVWMCRG